MGGQRPARRGQALRRAGAGLVHGGLFALCLLSALASQLPPGGLGPALAAPATQPGPWAFALCLMAILAAHELGHWCAARAAGMGPSLPYFLPVPFFFFGTLGAVMRARRPAPDPAALLRMAAAGPWAGALVAVPIASWGLGHSGTVAQGGMAVAGLQLGDSLLFWGLGRLFGPGGGEPVLHPVALAGWAGLAFTALNLMPSGQLDGGHVGRALFGKNQTKVAFSCAGVLALWGVWGLADGGGSAPYVIWAPLLALGARRSAQVDHPARPLGRWHRAGAWATVGLFAATFVPAPVRWVARVAAWPPPPPAARALPAPTYAL